MAQGRRFLRWCVRSEFLRLIRLILNIVRVSAGDRESPEGESARPAEPNRLRPHPAPESRPLSRQPTQTPAIQPQERTQPGRHQQLSKIAGPQPRAGTQPERRTAARPGRAGGATGGRDRPQLRRPTRQQAQPQGCGRCMISGTRGRAVAGGGGVKSGANELWGWAASCPTWAAPNTWSSERCRWVRDR